MCVVYKVDKGKKKRNKTQRHVKWTQKPIQSKIEWDRKREKNWNRNQLDQFVYTFRAQSSAYRYCEDPLRPLIYPEFIEWMNKNEKNNKNKQRKNKTLHEPKSKRQKKKFKKLYVIQK